MNMRGLVYGFPNYVIIVDEMKQHTLRPFVTHSNREIACKQWKKGKRTLYSCHHYTFCQFTSLWTDMYVLMIKNNICLNSCVHDHLFHNNSDPYQTLSQYFTDDETAVADPGFEEGGEYIIFTLNLLDGGRDCDIFRLKI